MLLSHETKSYLQCRRQILMSLSFFAEKVILELQCIIANLELLGTLIAVLEQKNSNEEISRPFILKSFFLSERGLVNANVKVKLEYI